MSTAAEDAAQRYQDWVAAGGHDYNAEQAAREQGMQAPYIVSPAAPPAVRAQSWSDLPLSVRQQYEEAYGPTQGFVAWNQQNAAARGAPAPSYTPPAGSYNPTTGGTYSESPGPYTAPSVNPLPGKVAPIPPTSDREFQLRQQMAAEEKRRNQIAEQLARQQFDLEKAKADALNAYNQSMLQFNDRRLAQDAFDSSLLAAYRTQSLAAQQSFNNQTLVLRWQEMQQARRERRPFRSARIRMVP